MGWASGSTVMSGIIDVIKKKVADDSMRKEIYSGVISVLEDKDWDTQDECIGEDAAYDAAIKEHHPSWFVDEKGGAG